MDSRALVVAVAVVLAAPTAMAAPGPTPDERETARHFMDDGKAQTKSGDLERALESYKKAHEIMHVPTTGIAVAKTQLALGHLVEARAAAQEVAKMRREPGEHPAFEGARRQAKELLGQLDARIPTVKVHLRGGPASSVTVDDTDVPPASLSDPLAMNPGKHTIVVKAADGAEGRAEITLAEKDVKQVELNLLPTHARADEGGTRRQVTGPSLDADFGGERSTAANVLMYGGFGLAVAGLAVGGITGALALSKAGDVKPQCENNVCDPAVSSDLDTARSMASISNIGFAVAGVGAILGIVGLVLPKTHAAPRTGTIRIVPAGAGLRGTF